MVQQIDLYMQSIELFSFYPWKIKEDLKLKIKTSLKKDFEDDIKGDMGSGGITWYNSNCKCE